MKKISALKVCCALLALTLILGMPTGCSPSEAQLPVENTADNQSGGQEIKWDFETEDANLFDNPGAFAITVGGVRKQLPFALSELSGVVISEENLNSDVPGQYFYNVPFTVDGKNAGIIIVYNKSAGAAKLRDCLVGGVNVNAENAPSQIMLPENIGIGSTAEEVQNAFGPPTGMDFAENSDECTYVYTSADNQEVSLTFSDGKTVSGYTIKYFVM